MMLLRTMVAEKALHLDGTSVVLECLNETLFRVLNQDGYSRTYWLNDPSKKVSLESERPVISIAVHLTELWGIASARPLRNPSTD